MENFLIIAALAVVALIIAKITNFRWQMLVKENSPEANRFGGPISYFLAGVIKFAAQLLFFSALLGLPVMWLWNYVMAGSLGLPRLDFLHALALNILCSLLLGKSSVSKSKKKSK